MNKNIEKNGKKPYVQPAITAIINLKEKYGMLDMTIYDVSTDAGGGAGASADAPKSDLVIGEKASSTASKSTFNVWDDTGVWDDDISMK